MSKMYQTFITQFGWCSSEEFMSDSLDDLKRQVREWIDGNGFGASSIGARWDVYLNGERVGVLSYNGKYEEV